MAIYSETKVLEGLIARLVALGLSEPVAWPNVAFEPPSTGGYLAAFLLPSQTQQVTLGTTGLNRLTGLFQVSVFWPVGTGAAAPNEVAGQIIAQFKRGTTIMRETEIIKIVAPPFLNPAVQEPEWFSIPVRIQYQADVANPA